MVDRVCGKWYNKGKGKEQEGDEEELRELLLSLGNEVCKK